MPGTRIQLHERAPVEIRGAALAIGGSLEGVVVQQHRDAIARELHVELVSAEAERLPGADRGEGILRREAAAAPVTGDARIGPVLHASTPRYLYARVMAKRKPT